MFVPPPVPLPPRNSKGSDSTRPTQAAPSSWAPWLAAAATLGILVWILNGSEVTIDLSLDGRILPLTTRAGTVSDLLLAHAVPVTPADLILPGLDYPVTPGLRIVVQHARPIRITWDGRTVEHLSHGRLASEVLREAGVSFGPTDVLYVDDSPWPGDRELPPSPPAGQPVRRRDPRSVAYAEEASGMEAGAAEPATPLSPADRHLSLQVFRLVPVTLIEAGIPFQQWLAGPTVGQALSAAGVPILPEDDVTPSAEAPLAAGMQVTIDRSTPFVLDADGDRRAVRARAATIGAAIRRLGVPLEGRDYTIPAPESPLAADLVVKVVRVTEDFLVRETEIPFHSVKQADAELELDQTRVISPGKVGRKEQRVRVRYENGREKGRTVEEEIVTEEAVDEVLAYGTQVVWHTVETGEGPKRYWRKLNVYATSYSAARAGVSPSVPWYGITRTGMKMRHGIVAVDPNLIPLLTNLYVPGYGVGIAGDTGGGIKRYHIDLGYDDDNYKSWHGRVDLYLLEPMPPERKMVWILP